MSGMSQPHMSRRNPASRDACSFPGPPAPCTCRIVPPVHLSPQRTYCTLEPPRLWSVHAHSALGCLLAAPPTRVPRRAALPVLPRMASGWRGERAERGPGYARTTDARPPPPGYAATAAAASELERACVAPFNQRHPSLCGSRSGETRSHTRWW